MFTNITFQNCYVTIEKNRIPTYKLCITNLSNSTTLLNTSLETRAIHTISLQSKIFEDYNYFSNLLSSPAQYKCRLAQLFLQLTQQQILNLFQSTNAEADIQQIQRVVRVRYFGMLNFFFIMQEKSKHHITIKERLDLSPGHSPIMVIYSSEILVKEKPIFQKRTGKYTGTLLR